MIAAWVRQSDRWTCGSNWPWSIKGLSTSPLPPSLLPPSSPKKHFCFFCQTGKSERKVRRRRCEQIEKKVESFPWHVFIAKNIGFFFPVGQCWFFLNIWKQSNKTNEWKSLLNTFHLTSVWWLICKVPYFSLNSPEKSTDFRTYPSVCKLCSHLHLHSALFSSFPLFSRTTSAFIFSGYVSYREEDLRLSMPRF